MKTNIKISFRILILVIILSSMYFLNLQAVEEKIFFDEFRDDPSKARFVIEAENYSSRISTASNSWDEVDGQTNEFIEGSEIGNLAPTAKPGARGNYMVVLGRGKSRDIPISESYQGSVIDYKVSIEKAGKYRLYLRWTGHDQRSDSVYALILKPDGMLLKSVDSDSPNFFAYLDRLDWTWDNTGIKDEVNTSSGIRNADAVWMIPEPGIYTIRLAVREQETALDTLVFQTENLPAPTE